MSAVAEIMPNKKLHDPFDEKKAIQNLINNGRLFALVSEGNVPSAVNTSHTNNVEEDAKVKETAIMKLGETLAERKSFDHLRNLIERELARLEFLSLTALVHAGIRSEVQKLGNAKASKVVRNLVDLFLETTVDPNAPSGSKFNDIQSLNDVKVRLVWLSSALRLIYPCRSSSVKSASSGQRRRIVSTYARRSQHVSFVCTTTLSVVNKRCDLVRHLPRTC